MQGQEDRIDAENPNYKLPKIQKFDLEAGGDSIGRVLMIEFDNQDSSVFDEIMMILEKHPAFEKLKLNGKVVLSFLVLKYIRRAEKFIVTGRKYI